MYKNKLTFIEKKHETDDIYTFVFKPDTEINWKAGQYIEYRLGFGLVKHFTIASAPYEGTINLTTRIFKKHSDFKEKLIKLQSGDKVSTKTPIGDLIINDMNAEYVFIAGGIGITPFRAILWDLHFKNIDPKITLLYANNTDTPAFKKQLDELVNNNNNLHIKYFLNNQRVEAKDIKEYSSLNTIFLVSGPPVMIEAYRKILKDLSIPKQNILVDSFIGY
jgi:ferredoxin-NADP reductase